MMKQHSGTFGLDPYTRPNFGSHACFRKRRTRLSHRRQFLFPQACESGRWKTNNGGGRKGISQVADAMGVRHRTLTQYESYLRPIGERFGNRPISEVRSSDIEEWLGLLSQIGRSELATTTSARFRRYSFLPAIVTTALEILPKRLQEPSWTIALLGFLLLKRWRSCHSGGRPGMLA
jgi:hypothetical protein